MFSPIERFTALITAHVGRCNRINLDGKRQKAKSGRIDHRDHFFLTISANTESRVAATVGNGRTPMRSLLVRSPIAIALFWISAYLLITVLPLFILQRFSHQ
jgi:hypothetical protein